MNIPVISDTHGSFGKVGTFEAVTTDAVGRILLSHGNPFEQ